MKKSISFLQGVLKRVVIIGAVYMVICLTCAATTTADTSSLDKVVDWIASWSGRIGLVVAFFGGIQTSLAFKNDDADAKVRGLKTLVSGFMVFGISKSLDLFGL